MRSSFWKRFCIVAMLIFSTLQFLSAVSRELSFEVGTILESDSPYRYRYAQHPWATIKDGQTVLDLHSFDDNDCLVIQRNVEGTAWDEEHYYRFDSMEGKWHLIQNPLLDVRLSVSSPDASVTSFRYQAGTTPSKDWKFVEQGKTLIELPWFDPATLLFVQQSKDGKDWGDVYRYQYDPETKSWNVLPLASAIGRGNDSHPSRTQPKNQEPLIGLRLNISAPDTSYTSFRYQTGTIAGTEWVAVEQGKTLIELPWFDPTSLLFVQQSKDGKDWGDVYRYQYDAETKVWRVLPSSSEPERSISPFVMLLRTTESLHHIYEARYGGGVEYMQESPLHPQLMLVGDLAVSGASLNNIWIERFLILDASLGLGYRIPLMKHLNLVPSVMYGLLVHMGNADFTNDGSAKRQFYIDQQLRGSLSFEYALTERMCAVIRPEALVFFEANHIGMQYGIGAGLQFKL